MRIGRGRRRWIPCHLTGTSTSLGGGRLLVWSFTAPRFNPSWGAVKAQHNYSDRATLIGDIQWAVFGSDVAKVADRARTGLAVRDSSELGRPARQDAAAG